MKSRKLNVDQEFEKCLMDAIEEALALLGDGAKEAVYFKVETSFDIKKDDIPKNVEGFCEAIEKIFGVGASYLESIFTRCLHSKIANECKLQALEYGLPEITFREYVFIAKEILINSQNSPQRL